MLIRVGFDLVFDLPGATPVMFLIYLHPSRLSTVVQAEKFRVEPAV